MEGYREVEIDREGERGRWRGIERGRDRERYIDRDREGERDIERDRDIGGNI